MYNTYTCMYICMYVWITYLALLMWSIIYRDFARRTRIEKVSRQDRESIRTVHANSRSPLSFIYNVYTMNLELKFIHWAIYNSPYILRPVDDQNGGHFKHPLEYFPSIRSFCSSTRYFCLGDFRSSNNIIYKPSFVSRWAPKVLLTSSRGPYVKHSI